MANINEGLMAKYKPLIQEFSLMYDFNSKDPSEMYNKTLANRTGY